MGTTNFSFASGCLLAIASRLGIGACVYFSFHLQDHICYRLMQILCMLTQDLRVHVFQPCCVQKVLIIWCPSSSLAFILFVPTVLRSSVSPEERDLMETCHLGLYFPRSLTICIGCGSRYLFQSAEGGSFSDNS